MLWSPPGDSVPPAGRASINGDAPRALQGGEHDQCTHGVASSVVGLNEHGIVGVARDHVGADAGVGERSADKVQLVSLLLFQRSGPVLSLSLDDVLGTQLPVPFADPQRHSRLRQRVPDLASP